MKLVIFAIIIAYALLTTPALPQVQTNAEVISFDKQTKEFLKPAFEDHFLKWDSFISTLIGGILAIGAGFLATWLANKLECKRKNQEETDFSNKTLKAIRCEVEALNNIYDTGIGQYLKNAPDNEPFTMRLGLAEKWFTVYEANAVHLGRLDSEVAVQIVTEYTLVKRMIENFRINNFYIGEYEAVFPVANQLQNTAKFLQIKKNMINQVLFLKQAEKDLKAAHAKLLGMLDERGIK
jgi:hypothetical protein